MEVFRPVSQLCTISDAVCWTALAAPRPIRAHNCPQLITPVPEHSRRSTLKAGRCRHKRWILKSGNRADGVSGLLCRLKGGADWLGQRRALGCIQRLYMCSVHEPERHASGLSSHNMRPTFTVDTGSRDRRHGISPDKSQLLSLPWQCLSPRANPGAHLWRRSDRESSAQLRRTLHDFFARLDEP